MKILRWLDKHLEETILVILLFIISFNTVAQVFCRYVLQHSLSWPEELSRYSFVCSGFFSLGFCVRKGNMLKIDLLLATVPEKVKKYINWFSMAVFGLVMAYLFYGSLSQWTKSFSGATRTSAMQIPMYVIFFIPVMGFALALFRVGQYYVLEFLNRKKGEMV